ncbi:hypothetical protein [Parabacteroides merdae]|jgi:hypothetical protein|uniref:Uncharacterized protein n=1 Tax=Parabacteroides merdae TaxID=46503 RepID=A0A3R6B7A9_9BACT|nr:hypothetical protein [Parabacteroides merdae]RHC79267.1 hypothetical protein DW828_18900 [Parabacteroides merdae]
MNVEVFIYGTPTGNCFYGKTDEKIYFDTFYNGDKANYLSVKIRKAGDNKVYCYYNYLVYQNVIGKQGRPGSFFGITLRLDAYCMDIQNIYRILDNVFWSFINIKGGLLKGVGNHLQYTVDDFNDTSKLKSIETQLIDDFSRRFTGNGICFTAIDHTFTHEGGELYKLNLYDYSNEDIFQFIKETGQIRISPYYPTQEISRRQQQYDKQLEEIRQQHESDRRIDLEDKNKLHNSLSEERNKNSNLQAELEQKNKEIEQLDGKIKNIERAKEVEYLIEQIKIPIEKLSGYIVNKAPVVANEIVRQGRKWYTRFFEFIRKSIPFVNMILIVVILLCISGYIQPNQSVDEEKVRLTEEIKKLKDEKKELEKQLEVSRIPEKGITIDIVNFKEKTLQKGKTYKIRADLSKEFFQWNIEGAEIKNGKDGIFPLKVTGDTIRISLLLNNETVAERTILSK